jgi:hypothetical protein
MAAPVWPYKAERREKQREEEGGGERKVEERDGREEKKGKETKGEKRKVRKSLTSAHRFVQDLRAIKDVGQDVHPTLPKYYMSAISEDFGWCCMNFLRKNCVPSNWGLLMEQ